MWVLFFQCAQGLLVHRLGIAAALSNLKKLPDIGLKRGIDLMKLDIAPSVLHHGDEHAVASITSGNRAAEIPWSSPTEVVLRYVLSDISAYRTNLGV